MCIEIYLLSRQTYTLVDVDDIAIDDVDFNISNGVNTTFDADVGVCLEGNLDVEGDVDDVGDVDCLAVNIFLILLVRIENDPLFTCLFA